MGRRKRRTFSREFKAKVALEALKEQKTLAELSSEYDLLPAQISQWKQEARSSLPEVFGTAKPEAQTEHDALVDELYKKIGRLEMELTWLKKKLPAEP